MGHGGIYADVRDGYVRLPSHRFLARYFNARPRSLCAYIYINVLRLPDTLRYRSGYLSVEQLHRSRLLETIRTADPMTFSSVERDDRGSANNLSLLVRRHDRFTFSLLARGDCVRACIHIEVRIEGSLSRIRTNWSRGCSRPDEYIVVDK